MNTIRETKAGSIIDLSECKIHEAPYWAYERYSCCSCGIVFAKHIYDKNMFIVSDHRGNWLFCEDCYKNDSNSVKGFVSYLESIDLKKYDHFIQWFINYWIIEIKNSNYNEHKCFTMYEIMKPLASKFGTNWKDNILVIVRKKLEDLLYNLHSIQKEAQ